MGTFLILLDWVKCAFYFLVALGTFLLMATIVILNVII